MSIESYKENATPAVASKTEPIAPKALERPVAVPVVVAIMPPIEVKPDPNCSDAVLVISMTCLRPSKADE